MIGAMFEAAQPLLLRFPLDRGIFLREYATNSYGAIPYFLSKSVVEIPQQFMQALLIYIAFYWISGIQGSFIIHVCILWLTSMAAASTALLVGCLASNAEVAIQASPPVFVVQLLFAGVFIPTSQIPDAFNWIQYICALKCGINLALLNEFGEVTQEAKNWTSAQRAAADSFVENIDVNPNDWYIYLIVLLSLLCFFRAWRSLRSRRGRRPSSDRSEIKWSVWSVLRGCKAVTGVETARCVCAVSVRLRRCVESRLWSGGVEIDGSEARFYRIKQIPNTRPQHDQHTLHSTTAHHIQSSVLKSLAQSLSLSLPLPANEPIDDSPTAAFIAALRFAPAP